MEAANHQGFVPIKSFKDLKQARQVGRIRIAETMLDNLAAPALHYYLGSGFVTRVDFNYETKEFEYIVFSERFRPTKDGEYISEYDVVVSEAAGTITFTEKRGNARPSICLKCQQTYETVSVRTSAGLRKALMCGCMEEVIGEV